MASPTRMCPKAIDPYQAFEQTERSWTGWSQPFEGAGDWSEAVIRSLLTLRAMIFQPSGGMVAAPTTSLPEQLGGSRNWDYRYCWLRDATFTLLALMNGGYADEATAMACLACPCPWRRTGVGSGSLWASAASVIFLNVRSRGFLDMAVRSLSVPETRRPANCSSIFMARCSMRSIKAASAGLSPTPPTGCCKSSC